MQVFYGQAAKVWAKKIAEFRQIVVEGVADTK